ncbi:ABC transporter permease [Kitasatospora sp. NE20-6]|uniref:ABC transporter permease n=1 Tax=Kitasatospora sp. NE20-6 TaxID=2859066 RepID=UPI0034DC2EBF
MATTTRGRPGVALGIAACTVLLLAVLAPGVFTGTGPDAADPVNTLLPPGAGHWLGTDENGRDIYARVVHGARPSLLIGVSASVLALAAGTVTGVFAAQGGRAADRLVGRLLDVMMSVPGVLLVLLVVAVLGTGTGNLVTGLALVTLPGYARLVRAEVLRIRGSQFVEAATVLGWSRFQVVVRHIVPNAVGPLLALATVGVGGMIVTGSALSFLGLGPQPPTAEWGAMLADSGDYAEVAWWTAVFPGAAITVAVLALSAVGQWLQDRAEGRAAR